MLTRSDINAAPRRDLRGENGPPDTVYTLERNWKAHISLGYTAREDRTVLSDMTFKGPLRVQRPFYPEGPVCHTYLLHPPGGMVSGDQITIDVCVESGAHALITTPSAGKIYRSDSLDVPQRQQVHVELNDATLEWLPQENIVFDGSNAQLATRFNLLGDSALIAWDMVGLGRQAGDLPYLSGKLSQSVSVIRDGKPLLLEDFTLDENLRLLTSHAGLMGYTQFGSLMISTPNVSEELCDAIREMLPEPNDELIAAVSMTPGIVVLRCFAHCAEALRNLYIKIWQQLRPMALGVQSCAPRIWST